MDLGDLSKPQWFNWSKIRRNFWTSVVTVGLVAIGYMIRWLQNNWPGWGEFFK